MFFMVFCLFAYFLNVAYVQIGVNECKCILCCTSMLPPMRRVALNSVQQYLPKYIIITKGDQAL